jgi:hypothetical protein
MFSCRIYFLALFRTLWLISKLKNFIFFTEETSKDKHFIFVPPLSLTYGSENKILAAIF